MFRAFIVTLHKTTMFICKIIMRSHIFFYLAIDFIHMLKGHPFTHRKQIPPANFAEVSVFYVFFSQKDLLVVAFNTRQKSSEWRLRRWSSLEPASAECALFAGSGYPLR